MNVFESWLYQVTGLLLPPVVAALVLLCGYALWMFGGFLRELLDRRAIPTDLGDAAIPPPVRLQTLLARPGVPGMVGRFARGAHGFAADRMRLDGLAARCQMEASRRVSRLNLVARAGPTLGLMTTLIPMGPALMALADNDVSGLARSLVVAFTATVAGLLVGLLCSTMGSVRRHWYAADLALVDELLDGIAEGPR